MYRASLWCNIISLYLYHSIHIPLSISLGLIIKHDGDNSRALDGRRALRSLGWLVANVIFSGERGRR